MTYRKQAIPDAVRRTIALRYKGIPGETTSAKCHYCPTEGLIVWRRNPRTGQPGAWVYFHSLELDHVIPELLGGSTTDPDNFVLACRNCNRRKGHRFTDPFTRRSVSDSLNVS